MGYYELKRRACHLIDDLHRNGKNKDEILFIVETRFGLGSKTVNSRIELLEKLAEKEEENKND